MLLDDIRQILNQNWIGTMVGVFGIVVGLIVAYSFKARSRIAAQINSLQLIGHNPVLPKDIEFLFKGNKVPNVTMSRIAIWNRGNTIIRDDQIVGSDPLRIVTSDESTILDAVILTRTRQVNDFVCSVRQQKRNEVECRFDYLDPDDGALIQLIHTGNDKVEIRGTLRGIPIGISVVGNPYKNKQQQQTKLSPKAAKLFALLYIILGVLLTVYVIVTPLSDPEIRSGILLVSIVPMFIGIIAFWGIGRMPPGQLSTQITSNETRTNFWQRLFQRML